MTRSSYGLEVDRDNWRLRAACRGYDPEWWSLSGVRGEEYREAHKICFRCPVRAQCLQFGIETNSQGMIFGGQDFTERMGRQPEAHPMVLELCTRPACEQWFVRRSNQKVYCSKECLQADSWRRRTQQAKLRPQPLLPCGTSAAFHRHRDRGEQPCEPCVEAERERDRRRRRRRRRGAA